MTLNDPEQRIAHILRLLPNLIAFQANYVTVVESRPIMSVKYISHFQSSTFGQKYRTLQRGLSAIVEHLVLLLSFFCMMCCFVLLLCDALL